MAAARIKQLELVTSQGVAGHLVRESQFVMRYSLESSALPSRAISLTMEPRVEPYVSSRLPPVLAMNLPEGFLLNLVHERYGKATNVKDEMNLLALTSTPTTGRVWARGGERASEPGAVSIKDLLSAKGTEELFAELIDRFALSTSLAGVMPKVAVVERGQLHTPGWIVKTGGAEYPGLAENEYICMSIAKAAGIDVPEFHLSSNRTLFVIKRFDVSKGGSYLGFEDMACLMGRQPDQKYEGSYGNIALAIKINVAEAFRARDLERFYRQLVLCVALRNGDAHLKNWGVTYTDPSTAGQDATLSPAYDLVCTRAYLPKDVMALGFMGSKAWPTREVVERFGHERCGVTKPGRVIDDVIEAIHAYRPDNKAGAWRAMREVIVAGGESLRPSARPRPRNPQKTLVAARKR